MAKITTKRRLAHLNWMKQQALLIPNKDLKATALRATQDLIDIITEIKDMGVTVEDHIALLRSVNKKPLPLQKELDL